MNSSRHFWLRSFMNVFLHTTCIFCNTYLTVPEFSSLWHSFAISVVSLGALVFTFSNMFHSVNFSGQPTFWFSKGHTIFSIVCWGIFSSVLMSVYNLPFAWWNTTNCLKSRDCFFGSLHFLYKTLHYWFHIHLHTNMYLINTLHFALHPGKLPDAVTIRLHILLNPHKTSSVLTSPCSYHFESFKLRYFRQSSLYFRQLHMQTNTFFCESCSSSFSFCSVFFFCGVWPYVIEWNTKNLTVFLTFCESLYMGWEMHKGAMIVNVRMSSMENG